MKSTPKKILILATAVLIVASFVAGAFYYKSRESKRVQSLAKADQTLLVRPHAPQKGDAEAKVTVVEFLDPECESCRASYPFVKGVIAAYPNQVKLVVRYAAFHGNSEFAIRVLEAARNQGKYWEALELIFETQPEWGSHHDPKPELIMTHLPRLFIDMNRLKADMQDARINLIIQQDTADANKLGVRATPTFFVNGKDVGIYDLKAAVAKEVEELY